MGEPYNVVVPPRSSCKKNDVSAKCKESFYISTMLRNISNFQTNVG